MRRMTAEQELTLRRAAKVLRRLAIHGSLDPLWDTISDIEAFVDGKRTMIQLTADDWIAWANEQEQARTHGASAGKSSAV
jgi:hypothetical protein